MWKSLLALSVGLYLLLSLLYWQAIPTGESPDEPGHLQCIEQVARYGRIPITEPEPVGEWWGPGVVLSGRMCYHMPLYYLIAGSLQTVIAGITDSSLHFEFPEHNPAFGETGVMFQQISKDASLQETVSSPLLASTRWLSILLGLVTLVAANRVATKVFPQQPATPVLATALVAGWPQFVFLSRSISNDVLATAFAAALLVVLVRVGSPNRFPLAALLSAGAIAAKLSMVFTLAVVVIAWALEIWNFDDERGRYLRGLLISVGIWLLTLGALLSNATIRQHLVGSGSYWTQQAGKTFDPQYWLDVLALLIESGWGRFGWMNVALPAWQAYLWWGFIAVACIVGLVHAWRVADEPAPKIRLILLLVWMAGIAASVVRINLVVFQPQFRFALASLPVFAALGAGGIISGASQATAITVDCRRGYIGLHVGRQHLDHQNCSSPLV